MAATGNTALSPGRMGTSAHSSPRTGAAAAPVVLPGRVPPRSPGGSARRPVLATHLSAPSLKSGGSSRSSESNQHHASNAISISSSRRHSHSGDPKIRQSGGSGSNSRRYISEASEALAKAKSRSARKVNDTMVYLDGPQIYACAQCRTHLTSHDEIISKSFHGRHGRAYLFDNCVNVSIGPAEDRRLITGLHSVCDIFCKRCKTMVGWTYARAYEQSQKYKEGKFIVEKINLHLEESDYYDVAPPAGERKDRFRARSISWGSESCSSMNRHETIYEYHPDGNLEDSQRYLPKRRQGSGSD